MSSTVIKPVDGLFWARPIDRPAFIPQSRPRGTKAAGLRYERRFAEFLLPLGVIHGQWFEFEDKNGVRYCQVDVIYPINRQLLSVVECKYTLVDRAFDQLLDVYGPVVECAYNLHCGLVAVFKNFSRSGAGAPQGREKLMLHQDLPSATQWSVDTGEVALMHWVGQPVVAKPNDRLRGVLRAAHSDQPVSSRPPPAQQSGYAGAPSTRQLNGR
jgi:hypothetical protein